MVKKKVILSVNINKYLGDHYMIILVDLVHRSLLIQNKVGLIFTCPNRKGRCTFLKRTYISLTLNSTLQETATQGMPSIFTSFDLSQVLVTTYWEMPNGLCQIHLEYILLLWVFCNCHWCNIKCSNDLFPLSVEWISEVNSEEKLNILSTTQGKIWSTECSRLTVLYVPT